MKPRRLHSATIFSMVTTSWASVAIRAEARRRPRYHRRKSFAGHGVAKPLFALFRPGFAPGTGGTLGPVQVHWRHRMIGRALRIPSHVAAWLIWHSTGVRSEERRVGKE